MFGWLRRRYRRIFHDQLPEIVVETEEAIIAKENALLALQEIEKTEKEVIRVSASLRGTRARNHFGDLLLVAMRRRGYPH
jgi:hypothetical protein